MRATVLASLLTLGVFLPHSLQAACTTLVKGPVAVQVQQCTDVVPETAFDLKDPKYSFIRGLPPANRKTFYDTYRGRLIKGYVSQSQAVRTGVSEQKGALAGETVSFYTAAKDQTCDALLTKVVEANLDEVCCDGGGNAPCLLDTGYVLKDLKMSDKSASIKNTQQKRSPVAVAAYAEAGKQIKMREFKKAVITLEELQKKEELDTLGMFQLAALYRQTDKCPKAMGLLEKLHQQFESKTYWTDTELAVRRGTMLYARCLSMGGKGSQAVLVLQGFLVEPKNYEKEIKESLAHKDFGYIRTSKAFIRYKADAEKALANLSTETEEDSQDAESLFSTPE